MHISRSVRIPIGWSRSLTIGTQPQALSHINCAARLSVSSGRQALTSLFITRSAFIAGLSRRHVLAQAWARRLPPGQRDRALHTGKDVGDLGLATSSPGQVLPATS